MLFVFLFLSSLTDIILLLLSSLGSDMNELWLLNRHEKFSGNSKLSIYVKCKHLSTKFYVSY
ncbi:CLUMA_CG003525, isoform A [Clunio marinus]|uniref:CLUMA_CG003525, isoform A n=1 Tax=Clunio marinus TaxID=568069 RepID=A0A1J1HP62_9DIPT|nr:CLUMA_CG003525, isoform A [Clunio marinus]